MDYLPTRFYQLGDKVLVRPGYGGSRPWVPARVIKINLDGDVKVATSLSQLMTIGYRDLPIGTPVYEHVEARNVRLVAHDPGWDPYTVEPFARPFEYRCVGGIPRCPMRLPGSQHEGAYIPAADYEPADPAWVWETDSGWHRAVVIDSKPSWVSVRITDSYRLPNGRTSKSYRPAEVWPVICDYPEPVLKITPTTTWAKVDHLHPALLVAQALRNGLRTGGHPGL